MKNRLLVTLLSSFLVLTACSFNNDSKKEEDDPKEYYCLGCVNSNSKHLSFCEIKKCAESKKNASCAFCKSFPCSRLDNISSETLEHLKELRKDGE